LTVAPSGQSGARLVPAFLALLSAQLTGEALARLVGLPLPGPVIGLILLLAGCIAFPGLAALVRPIAQGILGHLSLLFVPAGVGVIGHLGLLGREGWPLLAAVVLSTGLAIAVGALTFAAVAHLTGAEPGPGDRRE
jgi:holin-like protein